MSEYNDLAFVYDFEESLPRKVFSVGHSDAGEIVLEDGMPIMFDDLVNRLNQLDLALFYSIIDRDRLSKGLESIAKNTCCDTCQEAARVAEDILRPTRNAAGNILL